MTLCCVLKTKILCKQGFGPPVPTDERKVEI